MPTPRITLDLPLPPSVNNADGIGTRRKDKTALIEDEGGRIRVKTRTEFRAALYKMPHVVRWRNAAGQEVLVQRPRLPIKYLPAGWYGVRMLWPADAAADTDNMVKLAVDFLHWMRITPDDRWLWRETATRSLAVAPGRCRVTAWHIGER